MPFRSIYVQARDEKYPIPEWIVVGANSAFYPVYAECRYDVVISASSRIEGIGRRVEPFVSAGGGVDGHQFVAGELADFAPVGQSVFCQGWQLCVKNAASLGWIATT